MFPHRFKQNPEGGDLLGDFIMQIKSEFAPLIFLRPYEGPCKRSNLFLALLVLSNVQNGS